MDATPDTGPTILYVDDEQQACKWFARMVSASYNVLTANSVEEAKGRCCATCTTASAWC